MEKSLWWKNFQLGEELDISGRFIFNGLRYFHEMDTLQYETDLFEVFYNLSVGLERLFKIAVVLLEHNNDMDQTKFEKSLKTHNHMVLLKRINEKQQVNLSCPQNELLKILGIFYNKLRYGRYNLTTMRVTEGEKELFLEYIKKYLKAKIEPGTSIFVTYNNNKIKRYIGNIIGKISEQIYRIIIQEAERLDIYTYELRCDSKASKIFLSKEYNFFKEDLLLRELLIFLINNESTSGNLGFIKELNPLDFDPAEDSEYIQCFESDERKIAILGTLDELYIQMDESYKERVEKVKLIGNPNCYFDLDEDDDFCDSGE